MWWGTRNQAPVLSKYLKKNSLEILAAQTWNCAGEAKENNAWNESFQGAFTLHCLSKEVTRVHEDQQESMQNQSAKIWNVLWRV